MKCFTIILRINSFFSHNAPYHVYLWKYTKRTDAACYLALFSCIFFMNIVHVQQKITWCIKSCKDLYMNKQSVKHFFSVVVICCGSYIQKTLRKCGCFVIFFYCCLRSFTGTYEKKKLQSTFWHVSCFIHLTATIINMAEQQL